MELITTLNYQVGEKDSDSQKNQVDEFMKENFPGALGAKISEEQKNDWEYVRVEYMGIIQ